MNAKINYILADNWSNKGGQTSAEMNWNLKMNAAETKVLKQYEELLEPFAKQTDVIGAYNYSTIYLVYPALQYLFSHLVGMRKKYETLGISRLVLQSIVKTLRRNSKSISPTF